jgi:hypothetical protein
MYSERPPDLVIAFSDAGSLRESDPPPSTRVALRAHAMAGAICIMPSGRIHPIDVPVTTMMKCISKWGSSCGELLGAILKELDPLKPLQFPLFA